MGPVRVAEDRNIPRVRDIQGVESNRAINAVIKRGRNGDIGAG